MVDGAERLKISLRKLNAPDNSIAIVAADGQEIAQIVIQNGVGRIDNETSNSDALPELRAGQDIKVCIDGVLVLSGRLYVD